MATHLGGDICTILLIIMKTPKMSDYEIKKKNIEYFIARFVKNPQIMIKQTRSFKEIIFIHVTPIHFLVTISLVVSARMFRPSLKHFVHVPMNCFSFSLGFLWRQPVYVGYDRSRRGRSWL